MKISIEKLTEKASNVKKDKIIKESTERTTGIAMARTETVASHEIALPGSNAVNLSHMSAKSVVKIATLSRATAPPEENHSASLPTISFGVVFF